MTRLIALLFIVLLSFTTVAAQETRTPPAKIDELLKLLQDPDVQSWLQSRKTEAAAPAEIEPAAALTQWERSMRNRIGSIFASLPRIPSELAAAAARTRNDALDHGYAPVLVIFAGLILLGAIAEALFRRYLSARMAGSPIAASFLPVVAFAATMAIVFFSVEWPPLARIVLLTYLLAFVAYRCLSAIVEFATTDARIRSRIRLFFAVLLVGSSLTALGPPLGVDPAVRSAIAHCFSVILLFVAIEGVWKLSTAVRVRKVGLVCYLVAIWLLWCIGLKGLFWLGIYAIALPGVLRTVGSAAEVFSAARPGAALNDARTVLASRGSRAVVILLAAAWLAMVWSLNPDTLGHGNPAMTAIVFGLLKSVIVILLADLIWHLLRAFIDRKLQQSATGEAAAPGALARASRLRTLLPIFRNVIAVVVLVVAALIVLAELGVEIGPLIAGAGIFGVAIGFGSQTLVKDVISGVFYMLDDAFRVGEYIQSGSYKGTVESFSLRSVRLRHHRGPVFTVPFGELGAVENMSRDWVIDKFRISVGYDTDIAQARKIAKAIGAELQADPEVGPLFIQPLKMKGVEEFGDYGIVLSFAMTTVPGQQTYIRRKAYAMIREAFKKAGIEFAQPTVQVGGDDKGGAAAAASAVRQMQVKTQAGGES
ncbi:mechanosensitive ion channel family protein [Rhizobium sp. Root1220]|uniref:mechanosensitive ion channel family protein n=1 Tax=Rhizobium sp. Root1220 TaxID=1736432 RepID=UPI0006FA030A|nr:mechanosensitive ion channel family protein [Rhizobium sp. Root1220]KQV81953.1 mechanosensitive ion channel protein [Rhizobium sp. Root1220]